MKKRKYELNKEYFKLLNEVYIVDKNLIVDKYIRDNSLNVNGKEDENLIYVCRLTLEDGISTTDIVAPLKESDLKELRKTLKCFERDYTPKYWVPNFYNTLFFKVTD